MSASRTKNTDTINEELQQVMETLGKIHAKEAEDRLGSVEELVVALLMDNDIPEEDALESVRNLGRKFVNWNEARVARLAELARCLKGENGTEELAKAMRELLGRIFDRTGGVHLSHLREMKISEARRALMEIEPVSRSVADRILMSEVPGANMPFSTDAVKLARKLKLIPKSGNKQHLQKLIQEEYDREEGALFYFLIEMHVSVGCTKSKCPLCKKT